MTAVRSHRPDDFGKSSRGGRSPAELADQVRAALTDIDSGTLHVSRYATDRDDFDGADWHEDVRELAGWVPRQTSEIRAALAELQQRLEQAEAALRWYDEHAAALAEVIRARAFLALSSQAQTESLTGHPLGGQEAGKEPSS